MPSRLKVAPDIAKQRIEARIASGEQLARMTVNSERDYEDATLAFREWTSATSLILERIFDTERESQDFSFIRLATRFSGVNAWARNFDAEVQDLRRRQSVLKSILSVLDMYEQTPSGESSKSSASSELEPVLRMLRRFHRVVRQLQRRHNNRDTLVVQDEYDVQDLLHALIGIYVDDIRNEEATPSRAGASSRVDFLLKNERVVIEVKKTRTGLGAKEVGAELLVDIGRYRSHQDCRTLVCFVYDPDGYIHNPDGLERDLTESEGEFQVRVIVAPKNH